jgi:hypothetical protein
MDLRRCSVLLESSADVVLDCRREHSVVMIVQVFLVDPDFARRFVRLHLQLRWALCLSAQVLAVKILLLVDGIAIVLGSIAKK